MSLDRKVVLREVNRLNSRHSDLFALPWLLVLVFGAVLMGLRIDDMSSFAWIAYLMRGAAGLGVCVGLLGLLTKPRY